LLHERLRDDELVNIGARMDFEGRIVQLLVNGWRPGHEALFPAAVAAFEWASDWRLLAQFGHAGSILNAAIDECALFDSQAIAVRSVQERILMLLRRERQAGVREIAHSMRELRKMEDHFPALLMVVTNAGNIAYWHTRFPLPEAEVEQEVKEGNELWSELIQLVLVVVCVFVLYYSRTS
jgi:hypothetical protein